LGVGFTEESSGRYFRCLCLWGWIG